MTAQPSYTVVIPTLGHASLPELVATLQEASPAVRVASELVAAGARVVAHDPAVDAGAELIRGVHIVDSARCALAQADVAAVLTDWPEYKALCWTGLGPMAVFDLRHCLDPTSAQRAGVRIIR